MANYGTTTNSLSEEPSPQRKLQRNRPDMQGKRRLSVDSMNYGIPTNQDAQDHVHEVHGEHSWRYKTMSFLHKPKVQATLLALLLLDVLILFVEIFLLASYPTCYVIQRDAISCCPASDNNEAERWLADSHHDDICTEGLEPAYQYKAGCDGHKWSTVHKAEEVLFGFTMAILSIFMIEVNVAMVALTPQVYFRQFFFLLDYVIVTTSFVLELTLALLDEEQLELLFGLLILGRCWRFVRISHGLVEFTTELNHQKFVTLLNYTEELEALLEENELAVPDSESVQDIKKEVDKDEIMAEIRRSHGKKHHHSAPAAIAVEDGQGTDQDG